MWTLIRIDWNLIWSQGNTMETRLFQIIKVKLNQILWRDFYVVLRESFIELLRDEFHRLLTDVAADLTYNFMDTRIRCFMELKPPFSPQFSSSLFDWSRCAIALLVRDFYTIFISLINEILQCYNFQCSQWYSQDNPGLNIGIARNDMNSWEIGVK